MTSKLRNIFIVLSFLLLSITIIGIFWLATTPGAQAGLVFAYAAGLSAIFLPCTLPLVFVIIPLAMKQSPLKGLTMAVLFGDWGLPSRLASTVRPLLGLGTTLA